MRKIKMLALLAVSAMALVAFVGTSSASATSTFTAAEAGQALSSKTLKGHVFTITGSSYECETLKFTGETEGTSTVSQIVAPTYENCTAFGFANAKVITGTCKYTFKAETDGANMATVNLFGCADATKGIQIEINVPFFAKCIVDIPHQSIASAVSYTNTTPAGGPMALDINTTMTGIMVDVTTSTGLCPLATGTHSGENGATYTGETTFTTAGGVTWSA